MSRMIDNQASITGEKARLEELVKKNKPWRRWGTYLSERQWGTVREDCSQYGTAWDYFPHDYARSRAYRWVKTESAGFATKGNICVWDWRYGMAMIQYSKSDYSD